jgi:hypothetical protein
MKMACMSDGMLQSGIFARRSRRRTNDFDIDALQFLINWEETRTQSAADAMPRCSPITSESNEEDINNYIKRLEDAVRSRNYGNVLGPDRDDSPEILALVRRLEALQRANRQNAINVTLSDTATEEQLTAAIVASRQAQNRRRPLNARELQDCLDNNFYGCKIEPDFALCNTHAFNIGQQNNEFLDETTTGPQRREQMNQVIGLKSAIIAQNLKQQYDFLNATVRQVRTSLQRAVMTAEAEARGAPSANAAGGTGTTLANTRECGGQAPANIISCIRDNYANIRNALSNATSLSNDIRDRIRKDATDLAAVIDANKDANVGEILNNVNQCRTVSNINDARACMSAFDVGLMYAERRLTEINRAPAR